MTRRFITGAGIGEPTKQDMLEVKAIHKAALKIAAKAELGSPMTDEEADALYDLELGKINNVTIN